MDLTIQGLADLYLPPTIAFDSIGREKLVDRPLVTYGIVFFDFPCMLDGENSSRSVPLGSSW